MVTPTTVLDRVSARGRLGWHVKKRYGRLREWGRFDVSVRLFEINLLQLLSVVYEIHCSETQRCVLVHKFRNCFSEKPPNEVTPLCAALRLNAHSTGSPI